ncbi:unnamed protein product [Prunus armeniaca]|uniref:Pentacotripeptide-repeat region of PRORP domain-containing protein n=1 Tax=Prunus armeniaca TaxID=36596 RepID=A0A6J5YB08_PRUAR|nr:unnamed protein product [Prunus armeniaca]
MDPCPSPAAGIEQSPQLVSAHGTEPKQGLKLKNLVIFVFSVVRSTSRFASDKPLTYSIPNETSYSQAIFLPLLLFTPQVPIRPAPNREVPQLGSEPWFLHLPMQVTRPPHPHSLQALQERPTLAEDIAVNTIDDRGNLVFQCLSDSLHICNSSSAVFDLVGKSYSLLNFIDEALNIVNLAKVHVFMPILDAISRIDQAFELLRLMALKGLELNLISYDVVINGLCREGRMNKTSQEGNFHQALVLQEERRKNHLSPNVFNVINAKCKAKNLNRAMEFFDQMRVRGLRPNERMYTTLIDGFSQQGFLNEAYDGLKEMIGMDYHLQLHGESCDLFQEILSMGMPPDESRTREAKRLLLNLFYEESVPDDATYNTLIENCTNGGNVIKACNLYKEMLHSGFVLRTVTVIGLVKALFTERMKNDESSHREHTEKLSAF